MEKLNMSNGPAFKAVWDVPITTLKAIKLISRNTRNSYIIVLKMKGVGNKNTVKVIL